MTITLGIKPSGNDWIQESLSNVFTPMTRFYSARMFAYLASQFFDECIYNFIKKLTSEKYLWLRNNLSTNSSSLVDNTIFRIGVPITFPLPYDCWMWRRHQKIMKFQRN